MPDQGRINRHRARRHLINQPRFLTSQPPPFPHLPCCSFQQSQVAGLLSHLPCRISRRRAHRHLNKPPWFPHPPRCRYQQSQVIDLFGELAGISFTPEGDRFLASVSDVHYSSVLQFERHTAEAGLWADAL